MTCHVTWKDNPLRVTDVVFKCFIVARKFAIFINRLIIINMAL